MLRIQNKELELADRTTIESLQLKKLRALLEKTWHENEFYRELWRAGGVKGPEIVSLEDFSARFPTIRKKDLIADQKNAPPFGLRARTTLARKQPLLVFTTSGTSGQGVEMHLQTMQERDACYEISNFLYRWAGLEPGDRMFLMFPITLLGGGRIELYGLEHYGLTVFPVGNYDIKRKIDLMKQFRPNAIQATTSYLGHISAVAGEECRSEKLKALFGAGEGGGFSWFERLQEQWDTPIYNQYGATQTRVDTMFACERGIGTRDKPGLLHNIDSHFLMEIVDCSTGKQVADDASGEIVMTSLVHSDVPLIRCAMGDQALFHRHGYCTCGRPFHGTEIGTISRIDDMVKLKGINVWPQAVDDVLYSLPEVEEYQILVTSDVTEADTVTARIMPNREIPREQSDSFKQKVSSELRKKIGIGFDVELLPAGMLARSEYKARRWIDSRARNQR